MSWQMCKPLILGVAMLSTLFGAAAYADIPYYFVRISCVTDLGFLEVQTFMLWNVCTQHGGACSNLSTVRAAGIYNMTDVADGKINLPDDCDLGLGKDAKVTLSNYVNGSHGEGGTFAVAVNGQQVANLTMSNAEYGGESDLKITVWRNIGRNDPVNVDINLCVLSDKTSITIPTNVNCSFNEITDGDRPFPAKSGSYPKNEAKP